MGTASFVQNSFLGGEWSPQMQGRFDRDDYRTGLNLCLNVIPIEEGSAPRRSGTRLGGPTRSGAYGVLREYHVDQAQPFDIELTAGHLRIWNADAGLALASTHAVTGISSANPAVFTAAGHGMATGDHAIFGLVSASDYAGIAQVLGRQLVVTVLSSSTFTVVDALSGAAIDGTLITFASLTTLTVSKIFDLATTYAEADLQQIRLVQDGVNALLLHDLYPTQTLVITTGVGGVFVTATLTATAYHDGPYLDIPSDASTLTPSAKTGSITFTASALTSINNGQGFLASDVGRMFRVFSEPSDWVKATAYIKDDVVKEADVYWKAVKASTGVQPSTDAGINWVIDTTAAAWTWGTIQSVSSTSVFVGTLSPDVTYPDNIAGGDLLYTNPITAWQLGAYSATTAYPSVGAYFQGRVWLGGAVKNRFDACVSNDFAEHGYINFAPTGKDGTVADNNAIAGTLNAAEIENFLWMLPDEQGILAGTQSGEWVIASSGSGEPITPTSILTRETTHYGSVNAAAIKIGRATIFVHRDTRKVYEYMANYFTQKFVAENLSLKAKHLTAGGVAELAYMRELTPVIWARLADGGLIGCTYKHDDPIKPLEFSGWHRHQLGTGRNVVSIQSGPANSGETDTLAMVTQDPTTTYCYVEFLQTIWDDGDDLLSAWYVDGGAVPAGADRLEVNGITVIRIYGLWYMIGQSITAWGAGLDLGDFTVSSGGYIDIPLNAESSLFTDALLAGITASGCTALSTDIVAPLTITAEENYDSTTAALLDAHTPPLYVLAEQGLIGFAYDRVRRKFIYGMGLSTTHLNTANPTGYNLWSGWTKIASNGTYDGSGNRGRYVLEKDVDTGGVTRHDVYLPTSIVPAGLDFSITFSEFDDGNYVDGTYLNVPLTGGSGTGMYADITFVGGSAQTINIRGGREAGKNYVVGDLLSVSPADIGGSGSGFTLEITGITTSDGTWRRYARLSNTAPNGMYMVDPWTGDFWEHAINGLCVIYLFRRADSFGQVISPWEGVNTDNDMVLLGMTANYVYALERPTIAGEPYYLAATPKQITAAEVAADYKLPYFWFDAPFAGNSTGGGSSDRASRPMIATVFSSGNKLYQFGCAQIGTRNYKLYRLDEPTSAVPFNKATIGGDVTEITPWDSTHGPNTNAANYLTDLSRQGWCKVKLYHLPITDELVCISKFFPIDGTALTQTDLFFDCTYVQNPAGTATFDHHSKYVTGFMDANWHALISTGNTAPANAAYAVIDSQEIDPYIDSSSYLYPDFDYTKRWVCFTVRKVSPGDTFVPPDTYTASALNFQIFVQYHFVSGSAPVVVNMHTETAWDAQLPLNADYGGLSTTYPVAAVTDSSHDLVTSAGINRLYSPSGIYDPVANALWWSGQSNSMWTLSSTFSPRAVSGINPSPPLLKLTFPLDSPSGGYCAPFALGSAFTSRGQILRPVTAQESMTQTGPSLGKKRRMNYAAPLLFDAQGVSMGVDFLTMRPLAFMSAGGTVPLTLQQTYSGIYWGTVDADSNYDNMWCWEVTRPYPCTVVAVELQHKTNENI